MRIALPHCMLMALPRCMLIVFPPQNWFDCAFALSHSLTDLLSAANMRCKLSSTLIATDDLPCMQVLIAARAPGRYEPSSSDNVPVHACRRVRH